MQKANQFNKEWQQGINRFKTLIGLNSLNINLKHPQTQKPAQPHEAIPEVFAQWQQIESPWDKEQLIFETIYEIIGQYLKPWQVANLLNVMRQPFNALELLQENVSNDLETEDYSQTCAALGKTLINLTYYQDALNWAYKAYQNDKNDDRIQIIIADALLLSGEDESAVEIYEFLMSRSTLSETHSIEEVFLDLFSRETGVVPSPVWAVEFAHSLKDKQQAARFWQLGEIEYYDSPYFRTHHAYYLADNGEMERSFAKLIALVQEMPWLKEASLNLVRFFQHFDPTGKEVMPEFQAQLRQQIKDNNWTTEGMVER